MLRNAYAANDNWYLGKGAQPNSYYTYKIQNADTDQGQPFTMNICFKQFNSTGTGKQALNFVKPGPDDVLVSVDAVQGNPIGYFVENADFHVMVLK